MTPNTSLVSTYAEIFKALAHPTRLYIVLELMKHSEGLNVTSIQEVLKISQSSVSQHLKILKESNVLSTRRNGTEIIYFITNENVSKILTKLA